MKLNRLANPAATRWVTEAPDDNGVWPALVNVYQEQGFEMGYARGVNDTLAAVLEATEEFVRLRHGSNPEVRRLLFEFSEFLETRVRRTPTVESHHFIGGLGI